jgi:L-ascorbate metabolism protein UlaG (beta-lactamase superfamily)
MARAGLVQRFQAEGLDNESIIVNGGVGTNLGGTATHGEMQVWCVPAVHSQFLPYPPVGYVIEIGGVRFYASGDTDVFGDLRLVGQRYKPDCALVCVGNRAFTMGPDGAALAVELLGCRAAIPIHYAHNPRARGPEAGPEFASLVYANDPSIAVHVLKPGDKVDIAPD